MLLHPDRFEAWADPAGNWTIWDNVRNVPATLCEVPLIGLTEGLAIALCQLKNANEAATIAISSSASTEAKTFCLVACEQKPAAFSAVEDSSPPG